MHGRASTLSLKPRLRASHPATSILRGGTTPANCMGAANMPSAHPSEPGASAPRARTGRPAASAVDAEQALLSIRQARDSVLAKNHELIAKLAQADERVAELSFERDAALARVGELLAQVQMLQEECSATAQVADLASPEPDAPPLADAEPLTADDACAALGAIAACVRLIKDEPAQVSRLEELDVHFRALSDRSRSAGFTAVHRIGAACSELTRWLRKMPARIPGTLPTIDEAIELLGRLSLLKDAALAPDLAGAFVYSVDDDVDNCECVAMALGKLGLRNKYAVRAEAAFAELSANPCDLLILDVNLPITDGFALHARLRQVAHHARTPAIFLSALTSTKDRLETLGDASAHFVAKPYNLNELGLKVLVTILNARLGE